MATLKQAVELAKNRKEFVSGNAFALNYHATGYYVIYSYGTHWPLYIYDYNTQQWYGNSDKYTRTTSKHYSKLNPGNVLPLSCEEMKGLVNVARAQF